jgi:hypothetical protein
LAGLSAVVALLAPAASFNLRVYPEKGETYRYKMAGTMTIAAADAVVGMNVTESVRGKDEKGWSTEVSQTGGLVRYEGQEIKLPDMKQNLYFNPDGTLRDLKMPEETTPDAYRLIQMGILYRPEGEVPENLEYTHDFPADPGHGVPPGRSTYKIVGEELIGEIAVIKIEFRYAETSGDLPARNTGTYWLHKEKGVIVKLIQNWTDAPVTGSGPISGKFTTELIVPQD